MSLFRLISERTVEENILKKANQKRMLGDMAIEGGNFTTAFFKQVGIYIFLHLFIIYFTTHTTCYKNTLRRVSLKLYNLIRDTYFTTVYLSVSTISCPSYKSIFLSSV